MLKRIVLGLVLALLLAMPATAQELFGTINTKFRQLSTQGNLFGCSLEYAAATRDHVYKQGGMVLVYGHISLLRAKGNIIVALKVVLKDRKFGPAGMSYVPVRPYFAYLQSKDGRTNVSGFHSKTASDTPGATNFAFNFDDNFLHIWLDMMERNATTLVYNRDKGGLDVSLKLDLTVRETYDDGRRGHSPAMMLNWEKCIRGLTDKLKK
ncbi:MAG: hypothetical protein HOM28_01680 [Rhodospirillales bacterium]|nr:hypothetical protein [Rhodospirillales bacterium]